MSDLDTFIDGLSDEEVSLLNSDPELLAEAQARFSKPGNLMDSVVTMAAQAALPSPQAMSPLAPQMADASLGSAAMGGLQAAGQTLRDFTRISPTVSQPGQIAGDAVANKVGGMTGAVAGLGTSMLLDPQTYIGGAGGAKAATGALAGTADSLANLVPKNASSMKQLFQNPSAILPRVFGGPVGIKKAKEMLDAADELAV